MTKKITLLLVIFLIWGCGYQPVYLKKNNSEQKIKTITLNGEQKINKIIVTSLGLKEDRNLLTGYSLILKSLKPFLVLLDLFLSYCNQALYSPLMYH